MPGKYFEEAKNLSTLACAGNPGIAFRSGPNGGCIFIFTIGIPSRIEIKAVNTIKIKTIAAIIRLNQVLTF